MNLFVVLRNSLLRARVAIFGAQISIEQTIRVSGSECTKRHQIGNARDEMLRLAAKSLGINACDFDLWPQEPIPAASIAPGMWLGDKCRVESFPDSRISGTFFIRHYYSRPLGSDDGRRRLKLVIKARGLLRWSPLEVIALK